MKQVYKVVYVESKPQRMVSAVMGEEPFKVTYKIGKAARPTIGKLFAFNNFKDADRFRENGEFNRILLCNATGVTNVKLKKIPDYQYTTEEQKVEFWKMGGKFLNKLRGIDIAPIPEGTVFCSTITPIRFCRRRK